MKKPDSRRKKINSKEKSSLYSIAFSLITNQYHIVKLFLVNQGTLSGSDLLIL